MINILGINQKQCAMNIMATSFYCAIVHQGFSDLVLKFSINEQAVMVHLE